MNYQSSTEAETVDELLALLADRHCRGTLEHFRNTPENTATLEDLADDVTTNADADQSRVATRLHHETLPKLEGVEAIDYDPQSNTARYRGHAELETMLDGVQSTIQRIE